ncbi:MAG: two-component system sensor histidine kinase CreC [Verrucomicrobiales bacterium]|nr:two-component system sensor histidine kinase CreC [Verrucomicrobiales bacterium]
MRLTLLIIAGFLAIAAGGFFFLMSTLRQDVERMYSQAAEEPLVDFAHLLAALIEQDVEAGKIDPARFRESLQNAFDREFSAEIYQLKKSTIQTNVYVTDRNGIVIYDSEAGKREGEDYSQFNDVYLVHQGKYGVRSTRTDPENSESTVFFIAAPIFHNDQLVGTLTVSRPENAMAPFAQDSREKILRWSLIAGVIVAVLGAIWTYALVSPIGGLTRHARQVAAGEQTSVPETGLAEIRSLSRALENMRRELEGKHYVENYVQALTHELKSPLAAIRGAAELIDENMPPEKRERFLENILAETSRSEDLVRRLVQLAALESQTGLAKRERLDFAKLVREEIAECKNRLGSAGISLETYGLDERLSIEGDPLMLQIAVRNLLSNAIDFSPESDSSIRVSVAKDKGEISLRIRDDGPGIPDYATERIFERFYSLKHNARADGRKGSGLGLCFVKEAAELHGGSIEVKNRGPQIPGSEAVLRLPG